MTEFNDKSIPADKLKALRKDIDEIDSAIVRLLCERYDAALSLGETKRALGLPLENVERESKVLESVRSSASEKYADAVDSVFKTIIKSSKAFQRKKLNLYFIGMPNCGKTRLAGHLGEILEMPHFDTDELVMKRSGKSIDRIFDEDGELAFRELEHEVLCELACRGGTVAATGGGIITFEKNLSILKNSGLVVFLDRSLERLAMAKTKNRPLIRDGASAVISLYRQRIDSYRAAADLIVDPDAKGSVRTIIKAYRLKTN